MAKVKEDNYVKVKLRRIGVLQMAKFQSVFMAFMGLISGLLVWAYSAVMTTSESSGGVFASMGFFAIIILPVVYAIIGFVSGIVATAIMNLMMKIVGGLELRFEEIEEKKETSQN